MTSPPGRSVLGKSLWECRGSESDSLETLSACSPFFYHYGPNPVYYCFLLQTHEILSLRNRSNPAADCCSRTPNVVFSKTFRLRPFIVTTVTGMVYTFSGYCHGKYSETLNTERGQNTVPCIIWTLMIFRTHLYRLSYLIYTDLCSGVDGSFL